MEIIPGQITLELLIGDPLLYTGLLLVASTIAGLLAGKKESDDAKSGTGDPTRENINWIDWGEDAGYGLIGGLLGLATMQIVPGIPTLILPAFGYAGRKLLINWGKKAEKTSEEQASK